MPNARWRLLLVLAPLVAALGCEEDLLPSRVEVTPPTVAMDALGATHQFSANVLDKDGRALSSAPITWTSSNLNVVRVSPTGQATAVGSGSATIRASTEGADGTAAVTVTPVATEIVPVAGEGQTTQVSLALPVDPTVEVRDRLGTPLPGAQVSFAVASGGGSVGAASGVTNGEGQAATTWTLGGQVGEQELTVSAGVASATFTATAYPPPSIQLSASSLSFDASYGKGDPPSQTVNVGNAGGGSLVDLNVPEPTYAGTPPGPWLSAALDGTEAPTTLTVSVTAQGLPKGVYQGTLEVTSSVAANAPQVIAVTLTVADAPVLELSRSTVDFVATEGGSDPPSQAVNVTNGGENPLTGLVVEGPTYVGSPPVPWLTSTLEGTEAPTVLTLRPSIQGLASGTYQASVEVSSPVADNASETLTVSLTVLPAPRIALSATSAAFSGYAGLANPSPRTITVQNGGGQSLTGLAVTKVDYAGSPPTAWLAAALAGGSAPTSLTLTPSTSGLAAGLYSAAVEIDSPVAINGPATVAVTLEVKDGPEIVLQPDQVAVTVARGRTGSPFNLLVQNGGNQLLTGLSFTISYPLGEPSGWLQNGSLSGTTAPATLSLTPVASGLATGMYHGTVEVSTSQAGVAPKTSSVTLEVVPSFDLDVWPLFTGCGGCHYSGAGGQPPNMSTLLTAYQSLVGASGTQYVTPGNPSAGSLLCYLQGSSGCSIMPPAPSAPLSAAQLQRVRDWIAGGALR